MIHIARINKVCPIGSNAGKFYGTSKIHKLPELGTVDLYLLCPIVSNIDNALYYFVKYITKILAPFRKSEYIVQNTKDFGNFNKPKKIPSNYQLMLFNDGVLFTNIPVDAIINIIIRPMHDLCIFNHIACSYLPDCYLMRFTTLSNYYLIDWCVVELSLFACWFN